MLNVDELLRAWMLAQGASARQRPHNAINVVYRNSRGANDIGEPSTGLSEGFGDTRSTEAFLAKAVKRCVEDAECRGSDAPVSEELVYWDEGPLGSGKAIGSVTIEVTNLKPGRPLPVSD